MLLERSTKKHKTILCSYIKKLKLQTSFSDSLLTLPTPISDKERKLSLKFYFHTPLWCLKRFIKAFKPFIKTFEAPQRSVKIKI